MTRDKGERFQDIEMDDSLNERPKTKKVLKKGFRDGTVLRKTAINKNSKEKNLKGGLKNE